ncbi:rab GTPase-binding effector protein 1-like isoform X2 [Ornithodoros turicata]|uniref:rab GTPase-binding effector protein 1-like isoform X2 n=1 Tax=Ornithodoros turicata TaxID=34597 RepID=UPI003139FE37
MEASAKNTDHESANGSTDNAQEDQLLTQLRKEKENMEADFGQKRARFMELFMQKEEELKDEQEKREALEESLRRLQAELDEARSLVMVAECQRENDLEAERRKCNEEVANLQHIMKEHVQDATRSSSRYEKEIARYKKQAEKLEQELTELRSQQARESDSSVENLEESMRKAQEDAEMLRSLVIPLEEEIKALKDKLRSTDEQLHVYEAAFAGLVRGLGSGNLSDAVRGKTPAEVIGHLDDKFTSLCQGLQAEKASRSDLEMYVAVLNTQKAVMQDDMDKLRKELQEVCQLLEREKRDHANLKRTWQRANDQFLEAQQAHVRDLARLHSVLSPEQQRRALAMQKETQQALPPLHIQVAHQPSKEQELEVSAAPQQQRRSISPLQSISPMISKRFKAVEPRFARLSNLLDHSLQNKMHSSPAHLNINDPDAAPLMTRRKHHRSLSSSDLPLERDTADSNDVVDWCNREPDTQSLIVGINGGGGETVDRRAAETSVILTKDQVNALSGSTSDMEARKSLLDTARMEHEQGYSVGKRVVSDKEWSQLEEELRRTRERLCQPCEMCHNYELQLQQVQHNLECCRKDLATAQHEATKRSEELAKEQAIWQDHEHRFTDAASDVRHQVSEFQDKLKVAETALEELRSLHLEVLAETKDEIKRLVSEKDRLKAEALRLQDENHRLLGRYVARAQQILDEAINLPDNIEELRFQYLKIHEDLIKVQLDKERQEESLRSEILFLREQATSEQHYKRKLEETLTQEADMLRQQIGDIEEVRQLYEAEKKAHCEKDALLRKTEMRLSHVISDTDERIHALEKSAEQMSKLKSKLEEEVQTLKGRVQTLQAELDNSEAVQRDFVKLSQSLQVELEKIRQSDSEVRWQHEDDVSECNTCKRSLHVRKEKHHCNHCGKIFCGECLNKVVRSGPKMRPFPVCNVCHTLLDHETAPYFSSEPPQSPS